MNNKQIIVIAPLNGSPAQKAGIVDGDILYSFNDKLIETSDDLFKELTEDKIGSFQFVNVIRNSTKLELKVTPGEKN